MKRTTPESFFRIQKLFTNTQILIYPDPNNPYFLFMDTFKYCSGATLCQHTSVSENLDDHRPIMFISGNFSRTQCNCAALVREAFAIYISAKRLKFLFTRCRMYHSFLSETAGKILKGKPENNKVNNWVLISLLIN